MKRTLLTGNGAAAWGARLAGTDYIPAFPITPQTEIIETLANWIDNDEMSGRLVTLESEHSMITAAGAAAATGVRVFSATSSQGLLYAMEMLYNVAGWRTPFVLVNVSRGLSAPVTLEPDHNDIMATRDTGCLQIHCSTCQEVLDSTLMAFRICEDPRVRLPVIVNLDGFYLSFTREPVSLPESSAVSAFLPPHDSDAAVFRASSPSSQAMAVLGSSPYSYFRYETHLAVMNGLQVYDETAKAFSEHFGRDYSAIDAYQCDDADIVFLMIGSFATKAKAAVDQLRAAGHSVGLLRPRLLRPFPTESLQILLRGKQGVAVIDQNLSMGKGGVLHMEVASALYGQQDTPPVLLSFIGGLGGRDFTSEEFFEMEKITRKAVETGETPPPRLLYNSDELRQIRKLQAIAHVERKELSE